MSPGQSLHSKRHNPHNTFKNWIKMFRCLIGLEPYWVWFAWFSGISGACWMGCRPSHCGKPSPRAQRHTHSSGRANEQPTGGTQLWGTHTHITSSITALCWELLFVMTLTVLSFRPKFLPTSRTVTLRPWPSWSTNTANYWSVSV